MREIINALLLAGITSLFVVHSASPQNSPPVPGRRCASTDFVDGDLRNPFTAKHVTTSVTHETDGTEKNTELLEVIARDSEGRVRFEKRGTRRLPRGAESETLYTRDGQSFSVTREEFGVQTLIFDCPAGKEISIQPGMRIAQVKEGSEEWRHQAQDRPFSFYATSVLDGKIPPDLLVEDLGYKEIEGIVSRGVRITNLGKEEDGEWQGKPIRSDEKWLSDDLAAMTLRIIKDFKKRTDSTDTLTNIRRDEPEASLFEIPPGYKINPTSAEIPFSMAKPEPKANPHN